MKKLLEAAVEQAASNLGVSKVDLVSTIATQPVAYFFYRRLGAPRYIAYGFAAIMASLSLLMKQNQKNCQVNVQVEPVEPVTANDLFNDLFKGPPRRNDNVR